MAPKRTILHCDMDAFYAAIEQRDHPQWRGKPVVVGGLGRRGVVSTCSYEARPFGVRSAMPIGQARALCPQAIYVEPRMGAYAAVSKEVFEIFESFTPLVEPLSLDEAFLDVSASRDLFGPGDHIARTIRAKVQETTKLTVSVGVAATKYVAKVASDLQKPNGLTIVPPGTEAEFLAKLPVSRLWGAGKVTQQKLESMGWRTIGDIQRCSRDELVGRLGEAAGEHFYELARGVDPRSVEPDREAKSIGKETTFDVDVRDDEELRGVLLVLSQQVGARLRREGVRAGTVRLKLRFPPFETHTRQQALERATDDDLELFRVARTLLDQGRRSGRAVRLLGVTGADLVAGPQPIQRGLFDEGPDRARTERLHAAVDAIRGRFGKGSIGYGVAPPIPESDPKPGE
ncbi:MAG: DNA polymerase IV [Planctomycetes bacterium]|nr:DNA polymerase IV [Planctomycetota bacterium]